MQVLIVHEVCQILVYFIDLVHAFVYVFDFLFTLSHDFLVYFLSIENKLAVQPLIESNVSCAQITLIFLDLHLPSHSLLRHILPATQSTLPPPLSFSFLLFHPNGLPLARLRKASFPFHVQLYIFELLFDHSIISRQLHMRRSKRRGLRSREGCQPRFV